jgi:hypothetical protein
MRPKTANPGNIFLIIDEITTITKNPGPGAYLKVQVVQPLILHNLLDSCMLVI